MSIKSEKSEQEFREWKRALDNQANESAETSNAEIDPLEKIWLVLGPEDSLDVLADGAGSWAVYIKNPKQGDRCIATFRGERAEQDARDFVFNMAQARKINGIAKKIDTPSQS